MLRIVQVVATEYDIPILGRYAIYYVGPRTVYCIIVSSDWLVQTFFVCV